MVESLDFVTFVFLFLMDYTLFFESSENDNSDNSNANASKNIKRICDIYKILDEQQKERINLIKSIIDIKDSDIDDVFKLIDAHSDQISSIYRIIEYAAGIRPKKMRTLFSLFLKVAEKYKCHSYNHSKLFFRKLLTYSGLNEYELSLKDDHTIDEIFELFPKGTLMRAIVDDDYNTLVNITSYSDFSEGYPFESNIFEFPFIEPKTTYLQMMAFFGAVKCFKTSILSGLFDQKDLAVAAAAGGNVEIIHLVEQMNIKFDSCMATAISYHHNLLADWLINNYKCENVSQSDCIMFHNYEVYHFFKENQINLPPTDFLRTPIRNTSILEYLLETGQINLNQIDWNTFFRQGNNLIQEAAEIGNLSIVQLLWEKYHLDIEHKNDKGETALHIASGVSLQIVEYLVEECHADINSVDRSDRLPVYYAVKYGNIEVLNYFVRACNIDVNRQNKRGETLLFAAAESNNLHMVKILVENFGANVRARDKYRRTPLHFSVKSASSETTRYLAEKMGKKVNVKDKYGSTPLLCAVESFSTNNVKYLIEECNANINYQDRNGRTILHWAADTGNTELIKYLCERYDVIIDIKDKEDKTPLHLAAIAGNTEIVEYLVEKGAEIEDSITNDICTGWGSFVTPRHMIERIIQPSV